MRALRDITEGCDCECRYENAIFHESGSVALVDGDLRNGYRISSHTTIADLLNAEPDGWTHICAHFIEELQHGTAYAGETSWGHADGVSEIAARVRDRLFDLSVFMKG